MKTIHISYGGPDRRIRDATGKVWRFEMHHHSGPAVQDARGEVLGVGRHYPARPSARRDQQAFRGWIVHPRGVFDFRAHQLGIAQAVHAHSAKACAGEAGEAALRHQPLPSLKRLAPIQAVVKPDIRLCRVFIRPAPALACVVVRAVVVHRRDVDSVVGGGDKPGHGNFSKHQEFYENVKRSDWNLWHPR